MPQRRAVMMPASGRDVGQGHVVRCAALADELRARGWHVASGWGGDGLPDVLILDQGEAPIAVRGCGAMKVVRIVDVPGPQFCNGWDLLVCGSAGACPKMFSGWCTSKRVLAGPEFSLLRPEFRAISDCERGVAVVDMQESPIVEARARAEKIAQSALCTSGGGMTAMEIACVGTPAVFIARNAGEELNIAGLNAGAKVDGFGCQRVADAIEEMCA
jgi:spore coat polysaccharide biosynthesis predicted glycosyltransferase SpsG